MSNSPVMLAPFNKEVATFYEGALRRTLRTTAVLGAIAAVLALPTRGWQIALTVAFGAAFGWLNFRWLISSCSALLQRVHELNVGADNLDPKKAPGRSHAFAQFLVRYTMLAAFVCAIFVLRFVDVVYFFAAFSLPVAALLIEAVVELWVALRKGL